MYMFFKIILCAEIGSHVYGIRDFNKLGSLKIAVGGLAKRQCTRDDESD